MPRYIETVRTVNSHSLQEWNELVEKNNTLTVMNEQLKEQVKKLEDFINASLLNESQIERQFIDLTEVIDLTDEDSFN